jgi:hypothetical protein
MAAVPTWSLVAGSFFLILLNPPLGSAQALLTAIRFGFGM